MDDLQKILDQLKAKRSRIDKAIAALESIDTRVTSRRRRAPAIAKSRRTHRLSPEGRRAIQAASRRRWAKEKKKAKAMA